MKYPPADKIAFVGSLIFFAFLYGVATQAFGIFPSSLLQRAWNQAEKVSPLDSDLFAGSRPGESEWPQWRTSRVYDRQGVRNVDLNRADSAFTLVTSAWESPEGPSPAIRLIDREGEVLHQWRVDPADVFSDTVVSPRGRLGLQDIQGTYLFDDGDVLVNIEYVGIARLDACGRVRWRYSSNSHHHSIARSDDGGFWVAGVRRELDAKSSMYPDGYPGLEGPLHHDLILKMTGRGEVVRRIKVLDVLFENGLERFIPHARLDMFEEEPYAKDITHLNDVESLSASMADEYPLFEAGDLLVSLRTQNLVFVFDPRSMEAKWHAHRPFIHQHDPDFIGQGWIGVFDNNHDGTERGTMLGGSRIVLLRPHTSSLRVVFPTAQSQPFYTDVRGKWQQLDDGKLLLTEAQAGRVVEVGPDGRTVWEWIHAPTSDSTVPSVTQATRVDLARSEVAAWPCSAPPADSSGAR